MAKFTLPSRIQSNLHPNGRIHNGGVGERLASVCYHFRMPDEPEKFAGRFCPQPFTMMSVYDDGSLYFCCPALLTISPGSLAEQPLMEAWNSPWARRIRETILDGSYSYCSEINCPRLNVENNLLPRNEEVVDPYLRRIIDEQLTDLPKGPRHISVAFDPTCNLWCPSCRTEMYRCTSSKRQETERIHQYLFGGDLSDLRLITMSTNGDPFASPFYLRALREIEWSKYSELQIEFITNGLRLTPEMWESVKPCHNNIKCVRVSVNAARPDTFAINQRGGKLEDLLPNLEFISQLRRENRIPLFIMSFYVLENNFREMKEFVQLGRRLGVDHVLFHHYLEPGHIATEDFRRVSVHLPEHPLHEELRDLLQDPIFSDPIVMLTNMRYVSDGFEPQLARNGAFVHDTNGARKMSWGELADFLLLREPWLTHVRERVIQLKLAAAELFEVSPQIGGASPLEVLVGADSVYGSGEAAFTRMLAQERPTGTDRTYEQHLLQLELDAYAEVRALLPQREAWALDSAKFSSLRDIDMGEADPFLGAFRKCYTRIKGLWVEPGTQSLAEEPGESTHAKLVRLLDLDRNQAEKLLVELNCLKDRFSDLCCRASADRGPAPMEFLAELLNIGAEDAHGRFLQYLQEQQPDGVRTTYLVRASAFEQESRAALSAFIKPDQLKLLADMQMSLLDVKTGYDPFEQRLHAAMNATAPAIAARPQTA